MWFVFRPRNHQKLHYYQFRLFSLRNKIFTEVTETEPEEKSNSFHFIQLEINKCHRMGCYVIPSVEGVDGELAGFSKKAADVIQAH